MPKFENIFKEHNVSEKDQKRYAKLINAGEEDQAVDEFLEKYINPFIHDYNDKMSEFMRQARSGLLTAEEKSNMFFEIAALSAALSALMTSNFNTFATIQTTIQTQGIASVNLRKEILRSTIAEFNRLTKEAMARTANNVLTQVRDVQRAFIVENQRLRKMKLVGAQLDAEVARFKTIMKKRFPDYLAMEQNQNFLKTRATASGFVRNLKLESYAEMSITTTLLNVDRTSSEVESRIDGDVVMEYYLRDNRQLKTKPRQICRTIINKEINGKSLLALDESVGNKLGIMTIAEAKSTKDFAMGPHCRHSVRQLSKEFNNKIRAMIEKPTEEATKGPAIGEVAKPIPSQKPIRDNIEMSHSDTLKTIKKDFNSSGVKLSDEQVVNVRESLKGFLGGDYMGIRNAQLSNEIIQSRESRMGSMVEKWIATAPKFPGKQIYRGIVLKNTNIDSALSILSKDNIIDMRGTSSWSSKPSVASEFASTISGKDRSVIFKLKNKSGVGAKFTSLAPHEEEVIHSVKSKFKILNTTEKSDKFGKFIEVTLDEVSSE